MKMMFQKQHVSFYSIAQLAIIVVLAASAASAAGISTTPQTASTTFDESREDGRTINQSSVFANEGSNGQSSRGSQMTRGLRGGIGGGGDDDGRNLRPQLLSSSTIEGSESSIFACEVLHGLRCTSS